MSLQQSRANDQALTLVGATVVVNGATAQLANNQATWTLNATKPATATITITASTGQTAFTGTLRRQCRQPDFRLGWPRQ